MADSRVPPHAPQAERSLLGAMLLNPDAIADAVQTVGVDDFYVPAHQHVFDAVTSLYAQGEPADPITVAEELSRAGLLDRVGGQALLVDLESGVPSTSNAGHYARIVRERSTMRRLIAAAGDIADLGYQTPDDVDAAVDQAEALIFRIAERRGRDSLARFDDLLTPTLDRIEQAYESGGELTGTPSGFPDLDRLLGGLQPGALVVIGARPATGKTALGLSIASHAALDRQLPTLVFSLEMSHMEIASRVLCARSSVDSRKIRTGQLNDVEWKKISRAVGVLAGAPLWVDDNPATSVLEIRAKARRLQAEVGRLGLIVVDYLQLIAGRGRAENRQLEVAEISRGLKVLARELDVPVVALCQLSRAVEARNDKRPTLADLRDSGAIEQDSDVVMFIYRQALYDRDSTDDGATELIVAKHRQGPTSTVHLTFMPRFARFESGARL